MDLEVIQGIVQGDLPQRARDELEPYFDGVDYDFGPELRNTAALLRRSRGDRRSEGDRGPTTTGR